MKMKRIFAMRAMLILSVGLWFFACSNNDEATYSDAHAPEIRLALEELYSEPGRMFHIKGVITDDVGIASIRLSIPEWSLDKTILLSRDTLVTSYELDYQFKMPTTGIDLSKNFTIVIAVTDVSGKVSNTEQVVNPNGDFTAPSLDADMPDTITVLLREVTSLNLNFTMNDDKELAYVVVQCNDLVIYDSIPAGEMTDKRSYAYEKEIPLASEMAVYSFRIAAMDKLGNPMESLFAAKVSGLPDFERIYLTDFLTKEELNKHLIGTALAKRLEPYTYKIGYYSKEANTGGVYFIPQKTDLQPICFGADPGTPGTLATELPTSQPITFSEEGYYNITINTLAQTYSIEKYTPETPTPESYNAAFTEEFDFPLQLGIIGKGFPEYPDEDWSPGHAIPLETDAKNPYLLYKVLDMEDVVQIQIAPKDDFSVHDQGNWWMGAPDNSKYPGYKVNRNGETDPYNSTVDELTVSTRTRYRFELDTHLNCARILKVED
jgi:hypothetical protein